MFYLIGGFLASVFSLTASATMDVEYCEKKAMAHALKFQRVMVPEQDVMIDPAQTVILSQNEVASVSGRLFRYEIVLSNKRGTRQRSFIVETDYDCNLWSVSKY